MEHNEQWKAWKERGDRNWARMWETYRSEGLEPVNLWRDGAPGYRPEYGQPQPRLLLLPVHTDRPRGTVIVCAGGAFEIKSDYEARPVAAFFHDRGFNAAVLDYRLRPYSRDDAAADGKRAVRWLRFHAGELGILPDRIAIGGFSAGGMLAGDVATLFDAGNPDASCPVDRVSSRPDAALIWYGAFSPTSADSGMGYDPEKQRELARHDMVRNLRPDCPPFFVFQTHSDDPRLSMRLGSALADFGIPFEVHTFQDGPHGGGLYNGADSNGFDFPHTARWAGLCAEWLEGCGF